MPRKVPTKIGFNIILNRTRTTLAKIREWLFTRGSVANLLMLSFIILSALGAGMIYVPAGFITAGVCCGIFGFLLGSE